MRNNFICKSGVDYLSTVFAFPVRLVSEPPTTA